MKIQYKENLTKLAKKLLKTKQKVFNMYHFRADEYGFTKQFIDATDCGTIGCALGIAVLVKGLEPIDSDFTHYIDGGDILDFYKYSERVFGLDRNKDEWEWCFSHDWADIDNTPTGASKRIMELVNEGLPDDWFEQMDGDEPYMFAKKENKDEKTT